MYVASMLPLVWASSSYQAIPAQHYHCCANPNLFYVHDQDSALLISKSLGPLNIVLFRHSASKLCKLRQLKDITNLY